jgi:lysozyme
VSAFRTSARGLALIESFEGFSSTIYDDGTGVSTVGFGTTEADIKPLPNHITRGQAGQLLARKLAEKYEPAVNAVNPANGDQADALFSFAYNLGPAAMAWDVGRLTRSGNYRAAADAMLAYDHAGGRQLLGLTRRRQAERALYLTPVVPARTYLQTGDRGHLVYLLTHRLAVAGWLSHSGDFYSAHVADVVRAFQKQHQLTPATGICGARTWSAVKTVAEHDKAHRIHDIARPL